MAAEVDECSCTGTRSCLLCEKEYLTGKGKEILGKGSVSDDVSRYFLCLKCFGAVEFGKECSHDLAEREKNLISGINVIQDFISEDEEKLIIKEIDQICWKPSQSGRRKQDYGPQVNFKKKKLKLTYFNGLPSFSKFLIERMLQTVPTLSDFKVAELCNLEYMPERGAAIDPHFDDFWLWGERLVTINLLSPTIMTMSHDQLKTEVDFDMPRRSLMIMAGPARHEWKHEIKRQNIRSRRVAITFRELSSEFSVGGQNEKLGKQVYESALSFNGKSIQESMGALK